MSQELPKEYTPAGNLVYGTEKRTKPMRRWHEAIIDDMLAFPFDTISVRAARLNYSPTYLQCIVNSDMFKAAYAARREQYSRILDEALAHKTSKLASTMLDVMQESVEAKRAGIPFAVLAESTMGVLEKLGFGVKPSGPSTVVQVNQNSGTASVISAERLAEARGRLREVEHHREAETNSPSALPSPAGQSVPLEGECLPPKILEG